MNAHSVRSTGLLAVSLVLVAASTSAAEPTPSGPAAAPVVSHRTIAFHAIKLPQNGSAKNVANLAFTAARSGVATVLARGYCNVDTYNAPTFKDVALDLHLSTVAHSPSDFEKWGVLRGLPQSASNVPAMANWTALREFAAVKGKQYSVLLTAREVNSTATATDCSGTLTLDIAQ